jgi:hypothetical protein
MRSKGFRSAVERARLPQHDRDEPITIEPVLSSTAELALLELSAIESDLVNYAHNRNKDVSVFFAPSDQNGFPVTIRLDEDGIFGSFGGLLEEFYAIPTAMIWVRRALSSAYRLRIVVIGSRAREWNLESILPNDQRPGLSYGHVMLFRRFRRQEHHTRQNHYLSSEALARWEHEELERRLQSGL